MPSVRPIANSLAILLLLWVASGPLAGCGTDAMTGLDQVVTSEAQNAEENRDYQTAIRLYGTLYADHRDDVTVIEGFARNLRHGGRAEDAARLLAEALTRLGPQPRLLLEKGRTDIVEGHADLALPSLEAAMRGAPDDWEPPASLAIACDRLGRYDQAAPYYLAAIARNPANADILNNYALSRALAGHIDEAVDLLKKAVTMASAGPQARENLTFLEALQKQPHRPGTLAVPPPAVK